MTSFITKMHLFNMHVAAILKYDRHSYDCLIHGQVRAACSKSVVKLHANCCRQASCQMRSLGLLRLDDTCSHQHDDRLAANCCKQTCCNADVNRLAAICRQQNCCDADVNRFAAICLQQSSCKDDVNRLAANRS